MSIERSIKDIINGTGAIMENANMDKRLDMLVRQGLMPASKLPILKRGLAKLNDGKALAPNERDAVNSLMNSFMFIVLGDDTVFTRAKMQANKPRLVIKGQELESYANKYGGIDKKDMMTVAAMLKRGDKSGALKYAKTLDTDPKEYILNLLGEEVEFLTDEEDEFLTDEEVENLFGEDDFVYDEDLNEDFLEEAYKLYHKSYTDAINTAHAHHAKSGLKVSDDDRMTHIGIGSKKPGSGKTTTVNVPATHTNGDSHTIHTQVYNKGGTHPYELNTYSSKTPKKSGPKPKNEEVNAKFDQALRDTEIDPFTGKNLIDETVKQAIGIASDKRYKGGNMTGAVNAIEKLKKGLSNHPQVKAVLRRQNEEVENVDEAQKPVSQMTPSEKAANDSRRKAYNDHQKKNREPRSLKTSDYPKGTFISATDAKNRGLSVSKESVDDIANNGAPDKEKQSYKDKFDAMLKASGKTLADMSDEEKKAFFAKVDAKHDAKNESTHPRLEGFVQVGMGALNKGAKKPVDAGYEARRKAAREKGSGNHPWKAPVEAPVKKESVDEVAEEKMDGVADGALEGDKHQCATKIFKEGLGEGTPLLGEHAIPDVDGNIAWYKTMFESGIYVINTTDGDVEILMSEGHMNHKKKTMKESAAERQAARDAKSPGATKGMIQPQGDSPDVTHDAKKDKGVEHIVPQLRKAISIGKHVTFQNGKTHEISKGHAVKFLNKYLSGKPHEKLAMQDHAHQSLDHFKKHI